MPIFTNNHSSTPNTDKKNYQWYLHLHSDYTCGYQCRELKIHTICHHNTLSNLPTQIPSNIQPSSYAYAYSLCCPYTCSAQFEIDTAIFPRMYANTMRHVQSNSRVSNSLCYEYIYSNQLQIDVPISQCTLANTLKQIQSEIPNLSQHNCNTVNYCNQLEIDAPISQSTLANTLTQIPSARGELSQSNCNIDSQSTKGNSQVRTDMDLRSSLIVTKSLSPPPTSSHMHAKWSEMDLRSPLIISKSSNHPSSLSHPGMATRTEMDLQSPLISPKYLQSPLISPKYLNHTASNPATINEMDFLSPLIISKSINSTTSPPISNKATRNEMDLPSPLITSKSLSPPTNPAHPDMATDTAPLCAEVLCELSTGEHVTVASRSGFTKEVPAIVLNMENTTIPIPVGSMTKGENQTFPRLKSTALSSSNKLVYRGVNSSPSAHTQERHTCEPPPSPDHHALTRPDSPSGVKRTGRRGCVLGEVWLLLLAILLASPVHGYDKGGPQHSITWGRANSPVSAVFANPPTNVTAVKGYHATLPCQITNIENKDVSWIRKRDLHILTVGIFTYTTDDRFKVYHPTESEHWDLEISSVTFRDSGVYECQVSTSPKVSLPILLTVLDQQSAIILGPSEVYVQRGSTISLECEVSAGPEVVGPMAWFLAHRPLNYSSPRGGISMEVEKTPTRTSSKLHITRAVKADFGNYTCRPKLAHAASVMVHVVTDGEGSAAAVQSGCGRLERSVVALICGLCVVWACWGPVWAGIMVLAAGVTLFPNFCRRITLHTLPP